MAYRCVALIWKQFGQELIEQKESTECEFF